MDILIKNYEIIKKEASDVLKNKKITEVTRDKSENKDQLKYMDYWVRGWNNSDGWLNYGIKYVDTWNEELITTNILKELEAAISKKIVMAGFSLLKSKEKIEPHRDEDFKHVNENVFHFGLEVPDKCALYIKKSETTVKLAEENCKIISFDDADTHFAINWSDKDRMILYVKFQEDILSSI